MVRNYGISFGGRLPGVEILTGIVLGGVIWWGWKSKNWRLIPIIIGGGLNWGERLAKGYVTDYWRIPGTNIYNNINDWLITIGVGLCLWQFLTKKK